MDEDEAPQHSETPGGTGRSHWQMTHRSDAIAAPVMRFDLNGEVKMLSAKMNSDEGGQVSKILVKEPDLRIVLIGLKTASRMDQHHASGPISIQPLAGRVRLDLPDQTILLGVGDLLMLESGVPHDVEAIEHCVFLLSIGRTMYPIAA